MKRYQTLLTKSLPGLILLIVMAIEGYKVPILMLLGVVIGMAFVVSGIYGCFRGKEGKQTND